MGPIAIRQMGRAEPNRRLSARARGALVILLVGIVAGLELPAAAQVEESAPDFAVQPFATGFASSASPAIGPVGLAFDSTNTLYVGNYADGFLYRFDATGGVASPATRLNGVSLGETLVGVSFGKDGRLYAALPSDSRVVELDPSTGAIVRAVTVDAPCPLALATDPLSGDLFVSTGSCAKSVLRIADPARTPSVSLYTGGLCDPDGLVFAPDGTLYAEDCGAIYQIAGTNTPGAGTAHAIASVPAADGIALAAGSGLGVPTTLFVNRTDGRITKVDLSTSPPVYTDIMTGGTRGDLVAVGPDGCLYATQSDRILKVTGAGGSCSLLPSSALPLLSLAPTTPSSPTTGTVVTLSGSLINVGNLAGISVRFTISGANGQSADVVPNGDAVASFSYTAASSGTDTVVASAEVGGRSLISNPEEVSVLPAAGGPPPQLWLGVLLALAILVGGLLKLRYPGAPKVVGGHTGDAALSAPRASEVVRLEDAALEIISGPDGAGGGRFTVGAAPVTVGWGGGCGIQLPAAPGFGKEHVRLWLADGRIILHHIWGQGATLVKGQTVLWASLQEGEEATIGPYQVRRIN